MTERRRVTSGTGFEEEYGYSRAVQIGAGAADVVRTRMFVTDIADADEIGTAHRILFGEAAPTATMVAISELALPEWKIELEVDAIIR